MIIHDFDSVPEENRFYASYGGASCRKLQIRYAGKLWMLKFPGNLKLLREKRHREMPSYSASMIAEWLGCHICETMEIPVQNTILGRMDGKIVVACEHLHAAHERLYEFRAICKSFLDEDDERLLCMETLDTVTEVIETYPLLSKIGMREFFWDMFILDAFIGNSNRNTGNWGVLRDDISGNTRLCPVYDNGNAFNCKMHPEKMERVFENWKLTKRNLLSATSALSRNGGKIPMLGFIMARPQEACIEAIGRIVPRIHLPACTNLCMELAHAGLVTPMQARFYIATMSSRYKARLRPAYEKYFGPLPEVDDRPLLDRGR